MQLSRVELTRGRVTSIRTTCEGETVETFDPNNAPHHFFVDQVTDNTRSCVWDGGDYDDALIIAKEVARESGLDLADLGGLQVV